MANRLKLFSLSDLNGKGEATLTLITQSGERYAATMTVPDLAFWSARIAAALTKKAETDAINKSATS